LGYAGGLVALVVALIVFIWPEQPPFGLDRSSAEHVRIMGPLVALWLPIFSLPLFLFTPDRSPTGKGVAQTVRLGLSETRRTLAELGKKNRSIAMFLVAHMIYADGLITLFAFGGIYAAGAFGLSLVEVVTFGIVLNVAAGIGAVAFAWVDDWLGSKRTIIVALVGLIAASIVAVTATTWCGSGLPGLASAFSLDRHRRQAARSWLGSRLPRSGRLISACLPCRERRRHFWGPPSLHSPRRRQAASGSEWRRSSSSSWSGCS
jgi:MFS-type transporter involved in bile tolerance (Atg22 family)